MCIISKEVLCFLVVIPHKGVLSIEQGSSSKVPILRTTDDYGKTATRIASPVSAMRIPLVVSSNDTR